MSHTRSRGLSALAFVRFLTDRRGGVAPLLGLGLIPLMGMVGAAVDYSRANSVRTAMQAVNLPTTEDVAELRSRLAELETMLDGLAARVPPRADAGKGQGSAP